MAEYIEREALIKRLEATPILKYGIPTYVRDGVIDLVAKQPAADVEPVKRGEWVLRHEGHGHYWECSACHKNPCIYVTKDTKYCPNCGAKMKG